MTNKVIGSDEHHESFSYTAKPVYLMCFTLMDDDK